MAKLTEIQLHIINSSFNRNTSYEKPLSPLSTKLVKGLTSQSSAEAEPTTIFAQSSASPLYVQKIIVNSQASDQLHEHDLQERQSQQQYAHPPPPQ